ncbi:MAG TPA: hypothetical protein VFS21_28295 [Roseiflexaceae bacterium]|nr:hypothetical protein [Roseiflexaceae bacterium]
MTRDPSAGLPACRVGATPEDLAREADRAVLYGALLLAKRPDVRLKPAVAPAARALLPSVQAFLAGCDDDAARHALAYARACGAETFLTQARARQDLP